jgi:hypothetical protein
MCAGDDDGWWRLSSRAPIRAKALLLAASTFAAIA